ELNCHNNYLTSLKINDCRNLKVIYCSLNRFTTLELSNLVELKKLISFNGHLTQIPILPNPEKITELVIRNNNIKPSDLTIFSQFKNLENLRIGNDDKNRIQQGIYNRFHDSLEPLKNLNKLKSLDISNTDIESGLEYLPDSINSFYCSTTVKRDAKCKTIYNLFANDQGEVEIYEICGKIHIKNLSQKLKEYKQKIIKQKAGEVLKDEFQALEDKHQKELQLEREELEKALQASQK
ncbi:11345_t:CDS:1, partial [Gigaspora margarita]